MSRTGREIIPEVWEWSVGRSTVPGGVGRPSRRSGTGWETLSEVQNWLGDPPGGP